MIYGPLWSSRFPTANQVEVGKNEWGIALSRFELRDIEDAFSQLLREYDKPPSLTEFINVCKIHRKTRIEKAPVKRIEEKPAQLEVAEKGISVAKTILRMR